MPNKDFLWRGTAYGGQFRVLAVEATHTAQKARDLHDLSPVNTLLMGKMLAAAAMLSLELKIPDSEVSLRVAGDGPVKGALAICTQAGDLRGYAFEPQLWLENAQDNFYPVKNLGKGMLTVIRSLPGRKPTSGSTRLVEGELAQNLAHYYEQSEQIPSAVDLGVLIDKDATVKAAGGFIIQQMPNADPLSADRVIDNLSRTPNVSDLLDMGLAIGDILARFVFPEGGLDLHPERAIRYRCNCSKDRFERALRLLTKQDLGEMLDGIDPECHFCSTSYHFSGEEIARLVSDKEKK